ncbi:hypothetical protein ACWC4A_42470, partial [Streptomyces mirabilis]
APQAISDPFWRGRVRIYGMPSKQPAEPCVERTVPHLNHEQREELDGTALPGFVHENGQRFGGRSAVSAW